jgi:hypothetical protein
LPHRKPFVDLAEAQSKELEALKEQAVKSGSKDSSL